MHKSVLFTLPLALCLFVPAFADDVWPEWRGPGKQGVSTAKDLPVRWGEDENVAWKTKLPGLGHSTPVIANGIIWLTTGIDKKSSKEVAKQRIAAAPKTGMPMRVSDSASLRVLGVDLKTGGLLHDIEVLNKPNPQMIHADNSYATPSPIIDGDQLYCHFGPSGMACVDLETKTLRWVNQSMNVNHANGAASSPILWKDLLIVHCDGIDQQYVAAINKKRGTLEWKTDRSGKLHENIQLRKAYATPLVVTLNGTDQIVSPAADWLYSYDASSGRELWKLNYGQLGFSNSARPVYGNGMFYICTGYMKSRLLAIRVDENNEPSIEWHYDNQVPNVACPVMDGERLYFASDRGIATCLNAITGEKIWTKRIGARFWASPLLGDGKLYFFDRKEACVVMETGDEAKVLSRNKLEGDFFATAAPIDGALILRTTEALYRIGR